MSVDQAASRRSERSRDGSKVVRYHDYIDEKIDGTRRMVKVVDLATALVELAVAVLLFLLFTIVVEHWVVPGGLPSSVRAVLLLILASGVGFFVVRRLWPLCVRGINPVYAAHAIEQGSPTLKNGLVNLLLFRQKRTEISDAVYHTLEEQAAHGLTRVPIDTTVDRTELIRLGYLLIAIVAVAAGYKVLSPKDPLVAAERVLMPWADIVPASRVAISEIKPGTETVSQGEPVDVSAAVHGLTENDTVTLRYTTEDGQIVSRGIPMKASPDGLQFVARLADEAERGTNAGVTRNLRYRIEAGDARSLEYAITVVPAATIVIERVDYHYPAYTGYLDRSVEGAGDIRAIEGTKITIFARANGVIREANVDFDADGRPDLQMSTQETKAHASFELGLREDRQTPLHASYVLRFANAEGRSNHDPVKYSITVDPDRQPEIELRTPEEKSRDAQANESVAIEIAARDPDFSLAAVRLRGEVGGREVLNEAVLKGEHKGQFNGRYALVPSAHELKEGDVLEYWAEAEDNRAPKPNLVSTEHKALRIVATKQAAQARSNQGGQNGQKQQGDQGQGKGQQNGGQKGNDQSGDSGQQKSDGQGGQGQSKDGQGQGQQKGDEKGQGGNPQPGESGGEQQSGGGDQQQSGDMKQQQSGSGQSNHANEHGGQGQVQGGGGQSASKEQSPNKPDQQQQGDQQSGAGGEQSKDGAQPNGAKPDAKSSGNKGQNQGGGQPQKDQQQNGQQGEQQSNDSQPVSSEGDNDAEAFNRIQKRMEQNGEIKPNESSKKDDSQGDKGQPGEKGQQGGSEKSGEKNQSGDQQGQASGDKQGADKTGSKEQNGKPADKANSQQSQQDGSKQDANGKGSQQGDAKQQEKKPGDSQDKQQTPGGEQNSSNGSSTSANEEKKQGSPQSQPGKKPTDKPDNAGSKGDKSDQQEPAAGARGKRESDSHGDQGGDKAGGGAEGGGQKSPHDGTGSAGQNLSADSGAGQSGEQGKGDTSSKGGKDQKSDHPTGSSDGKTPGKGSGQKDGVGDKPGGESGEKQDASGDKSSSDGKGQKNEQSGNQQGSKQPGDKAGQKSDPNQGDKAMGDKSAGKNEEKQSGDPSQQNSNQQQNSNNDGSNNGGSSGAGQPGGAVNPQVSITGEAPEGDAANLEYARKQTDLVVNKLADQLNSKRVDPALLKELGWSQEDLKRFVDRWQKRKEAADQNGDGGDAAKRELDDALRSLGLHQGEMKQNAVQKDTMRDLHEGYRGPVPAEYKDRLRAYNQGVSRAKKDGE